MNHFGLEEGVIAALVPVGVALLGLTLWDHATCERWEKHSCEKSVCGSVSSGECTSYVTVQAICEECVERAK